MKLLYLCLFLLQISFSLSSLSTFEPIDTNLKAIRISNTFINCHQNSTMPEIILKQVQSMNTFTMRFFDDSLLSHSFDQKEIVNIRLIINNCTIFLDDEKNSNKMNFPICSPSTLTECLLPHIDLESDKNDLNNALEKGGQDWEDQIRYVLEHYNKTEMYDCVYFSFCDQF